MVFANGDRRLNRSIPIAAIAFTLMSSTGVAATLSGRVEAVSDGDSLILLVGLRHYAIKIAAIDAPERNQAWGAQSRTNLSRLAANQTAVADCYRIDPQGRHVCKLTVNTIDIGLQQIRDGMAWWYRTDANKQTAEDQAAYGSAELMAKLKRLGLWRDTNPVPPWDFRNKP